MDKHPLQEKLRWEKVVEGGERVKGKFTKDEFWIETRRSEYRSRLAISPEPNLLACLCDWEPADGSPVAFYRDELVRADDDLVGEDNCVSVFWSVEIEATGGGWLSPFNSDTECASLGDFFTQGFGTPVNVRTGEAVRWHSLPIVHRFPEFWEELGYDPAPFTPRFEVRRAIIAKGVGG